MSKFMKAFGVIAAVAIMLALLGGIVGNDKSAGNPGDVARCMAAPCPAGGIIGNDVGLVSPAHYCYAYDCVAKTNADGGWQEPDRQAGGIIGNHNGLGGWVGDPSHQADQYLKAPAGLGVYPNPRQAKGPQPMCHMTEYECQI